MTPVLAALLAEPDLDALNAAALAGLTEIEGCHQMTAVVERTAWVGALKDTETFALTGRLDEGTWHDLAFEPLTDSATGVEVQMDLGGGDFPFVPPMLGKIPEAAPQLKSSLLEDVVDVLSGEVSSSWVSLDELDGEPHYRLERSIPVESSRTGRGIDLWVWVDGAQERARRWDARLPKGVPLEGMGRLKKARVVLEVDPHGVPVREELRGTLRAGPVALRVRQTVVYAPPEGC